MKRSLPDAKPEGLHAYRNARRRWTLRGHEVKGLPVLPPVQNQIGLGGKCSYFSCTTAFESHLRLKGIDVALSYEDLDQKVDARVKTDKQFAGLPKIERLFRIMKDTGVKAENSSDTYRITDFVKFRPQNHGDINEAIKSYLRKGPMVGVFRLNPDEFYAYGKKKAGVYSWSATKNLNEEDIHRLPTHAVCITGYGVDTKAPLFEMQNSYGDEWHCHGFGELYALDIIELYGFVIDQLT